MLAPQRDVEDVVDVDDAMERVLLELEDGVIDLTLGFALTIVALVASNDFAASTLKISVSEMFMYAHAGMSVPDGMGRGCDFLVSRGSSGMPGLDYVVIDHVADTPAWIIRRSPGCESS
ncbi:hypothetical protein PsYK624_111330 [Phanerochaete sordida]|uniref:Uncharacterized protein n=1 Tax=Phanerochaete sordida TaxID=48140 RepID=A0A9P3GG11_9APHY|nr:hypothetical protein PsYK624_111330 [Phanerochaete sordida]